MSRATTAADVYKKGVLAASLERTDGGVTFAYRADYLSASLPAVATSLPLRVEPITLPGGAVPPFFAGLLPEGRRLTALRRAVKTSADDELSLLLAVGSDTIGDVQIVPQGAPVIPAEPLLQIPDDLTDFSFSTELERSGIIDRVGIPGAQDKVSGRMINAPARHLGASLIVKLSPPEYPGVVENEAFFLGLAKTAGIQTVKWRVLEDGQGVKALAIDRFDRMVTGSTLTRLAFEDAAQVLGIWPADKYNVSLEVATGALTKLAAAPLVAARDLFQQVAFAVLTGNGDQHAKNLAVLATPSGEWRVSPAFDILSTVPYGDETLALTIDGSSSPFSRRTMLLLAASMGLPAAAAEKTMDEILARTEGPLGDIDSQQLPYSRETMRAFKRTLAYRRRQLRA